MLKSYSLCRKRLERLPLHVYKAVAKADEGSVVRAAANSAQAVNAVRPQKSISILSAAKSWMSAKPLPIR